MSSVDCELLQAFERAERAGKCVRDCYLAAVACWQRRHPACPPHRARQIAVRILLEQRSTRLRPLPRADVSNPPRREAVRRVAGPRYGGEAVPAAAADRRRPRQEDGPLL